MQTPSRRPDRTLIAIVSLIAAVVVLALIVVFTRNTPAPLDPTTPEGVVQSYSAAAIAGDRDSATELLAEEVRSNCDEAEPVSDRKLRLTLISTNITGDTATVHVVISSNPGGGPFGGPEYETESAFSLVKEAGDWRIHDAPWEITVCYPRGGTE